MFERCNNCQRRVVYGRRAPKGVFCSKECEDFYERPGFCDNCLADTTSENAGSMSTFNATGTDLYWRRHKCPKCHSIVQHKFFCVFLVPLLPLGRFRVQYCAPRNYFSRRLRPGILDDKERRSYFWLYGFVVSGVLSLVLLPFIVERDLLVACLMSGWILLLVFLLTILK